MAKNKHPPTHRAEQAAVTVEETLVTEKKKKGELLIWWTSNNVLYLQSLNTMNTDGQTKTGVQFFHTSLVLGSTCYLSDTMNRFKTFISGTFICLGKISLES